MRLAAIALLCAALSGQVIKRGPLAAAGGGTVWDTTGVGFAFRADPAFVSDGTNITAVTTDSNGNYRWGTSGITRTIGGASVTFGWWGDGAFANFCDLSGCPILGADRSTGVDARLAGINYATPGTSSAFRVTLTSSGTYEVRLALGDPSFSQTNLAKIYDGTSTLKATISGATSSGEWIDASGTVRTSSADWVSNNSALTVTFSGTTFLLYVGDAANYSVVAYLNIKKVS